MKTILGKCEIIDDLIGVKEKRELFGKLNSNKNMKNQWLKIKTLA